ncbi:hypothetical protein ACQP2U_36650 [Nocardia sp. CA-084685]|uniref:hypothetical protein n=1 Tax=Nocardia sp. CA-084685 TaxID=3239970 RepID=UPI003D968FBE
MSDGYGRDRGDFEPHERGRIFENGTDKFFRDHEKGYTRGSRKYEFREKGGRVERIQFDKIRNEHDRSRADSIEEKSGRIEGRKDEKQLRGVRDLLDRGEINHHTLRSVQGESISKECRELIDGLARDFPDKFTHQIISRSDAREIWARGLERESAPQLELPGVREQAREQQERKRAERQQERARDDRARIAEREQRARDRALARSVSARELNEKREQFREHVTEARKIAEPREKGQALEIDKLRESHTRLTKDLADIREIERAKARDMVRDAGLGREHAQETERLIEQNHEDKRRDVTHELGNIGSTLAREDKERIEREAIEKQREQVRKVHERAVREGVPREVMRVLEIGRIQPGEQPRAREHDHNEHRAREASRERERVAERERLRGLGRDPHQT